MVDRPKSEGEIGSRDDCLEKEARFGAYSVVLKSAKDLHELLRMGLGLRTEDLYLEVHVPDSVKGAPRAVLATFKEGALELADFLSEMRIKPGWLIGVTHQNVARPAQRFLNFQGFPTKPWTARKRKGSLRGTTRPKDGKAGSRRGRSASVTRATPPSWISPRACGVGNRLNEGPPDPERTCSHLFIAAGSPHVAA